MIRACARHVSLLGLGALLALGGCVDMFVSETPPDAPRWHGTTTAGRPDLAACAPFDVDVAIFSDPFYVADLVSGRAYRIATPDTVPERIVDATTTWWVDGFMNPAAFVQFETRMQRPIFFRARPYAVWRGTRVGDRILLVESGSPCGRELVLTQG